MTPGAALKRWMDEIRAGFYHGHECPNDGCAGCKAERALARFDRAVVVEGRVRVAEGRFIDVYVSPGGPTDMKDAAAATVLVLPVGPGEGEGR